MDFRIDSDFTTFVSARTTSTMDLARVIASKLPDSEHILAVLAREQVSGRGRGGSTWKQAGIESKAGVPANGTPSSLGTPTSMSQPDLDALKIFSSFAGALELETDMLPLTFVVPAARLKIPVEWLTQAVGCAMLDALRQTTLFMRTTFTELPYFNHDPDCELLIKWPNDLVYKAQTLGKETIANQASSQISYHKVAGILCETSSQGQNFSSFFIGIGLNLFARPAGESAAGSVWEWLVDAYSPKKAERAAAHKWLGGLGNRRVVLSRLCSALQTELAEYICVPRSSGQLKGLTLERSLPQGTILRVNKGAHTGPFAGLSDNGGLLLEGIREPFVVGDVVPLVAPPPRTSGRSSHAGVGVPRVASGADTRADTGAGSQKVTPTTALHGGTAQGNATQIAPSRPPEAQVVGFDFGNSRLHWAIIPIIPMRRASDNGWLQGDIFYSLTPEEFKVALRPLLEALKPSRHADVRFVYTSVSDRKRTLHCLEIISELCRVAFPEIKIIHEEVSADLILEISGMQGQYSADSLGADRALRFAAARHRASMTSKAVAVVSAGTALTGECVSPEGRILDSFIAPGLQMSLDALYQFTAKLPKLEWASNLQVPSDNKPDQASHIPDGLKGEELAPSQEFSTQAALLRGVTLTLLGAVEILLRTHAVSEVIVTGGNAAEIVLLLQGTPGLLPDGCQCHANRALELQTLIELAKHTQKNHPHRRTGIGPFLTARTLLGQAAVAQTAPLEAVLGTSSLVMSSAISSVTPSGKPSFQGSMGESQTQINEPSETSSGLIRSMLRARVINRDVLMKVTPRREEFRKLGGRAENVGIGDRFDRFLANRFQFHTRELWRARILAGEVLIQHNAPKNPLESPLEGPANMSAVKHTYRLKPFDQVWVFHPPEYEPDSLGTCEVVADDGDTVVFSKPGNLVIHAAGLYGRNTFIGLARSMGYGDAAPVHRIDRETSGLLVCARSPKMRNAFAKAFREGTMRKMYIAVSKGQTPLPDRFRVEMPIGGAPWSRIRLKLWVGGPDAQDAQTHVARLSQHEDYSLFACLPQTGRTNQIRIHLAAIGHWIVGDKMYHPDEQVFLDFYEHGMTPWVQEQTLFARHLLHNTAIQAPGDIDLPIGHTGIVCPFSPDMMEYEVFRALLEKACIPLEPTLQMECLHELFQTLADWDFSLAPVMSECPAASAERLAVLGLGST